MEKIGLLSARLLIPAILILCAAGTGHAVPIGVPAIQSAASNVQTTRVDGIVVVGWEFRPNVDIKVTELGLADTNPSGFEVASEVGLWTSSGDLLASAIFPAGTVADVGPGALISIVNSTGVFRYVDIPDVMLAGGFNYVIGALQTENFAVLDDAVVTFDPVIEFVQPRRSFGLPGLEFPDPSSIPQVGANFLFAVVPEPGTLTLFGFGLVGLGFARRCKSGQ